MRPVAAVLGGLLLAASFPPIGASWLAPLAVALITVSTVTARRVRGGFGWGLLGGLTFFLVLLAWIDVLGVDAWLLLATYCALWLGALGAANRILRRLPAWPLWIAAAWVAQEALRLTKELIAARKNKVFTHPDGLVIPFNSGYEANMHRWIRAKEIVATTGKPFQPQSLANITSLSELSATVDGKRPAEYPVNKYDDATMLFVDPDGLPPFKK